MSTGPVKNRGGREPWATPEQIQWLKTKLPGYTAAKANQTTSEFWPDLYERWWKEFPLGDPSPKDLEVGLTDAKQRRKARMIVSRQSYAKKKTHAFGE
jgi:hypothetical protein